MRRRQNRCYILHVDPHLTIIKRNILALPCASFSLCVCVVVLCCVVFVVLCCVVLSCVCCVVL